MVRASQAVDRRRRRPRRAARPALPHLHRPGPGRLQVGRRRPPVHRLPHRQRRPAPRPRPSGHRRGRHQGGPARHPLRQRPPAPGRVGRADPVAGAVRRARALHELGHRVRHAGLPGGAGAHGPADDPPLHRPLPRVGRRAHHGLRAALRRAAVDRARAGPPPRHRDDPRQRPRRGRPDPRPARRRRGGDPRAERRLVGAASPPARVPRGPPRRDPAPRDAPHLRRGHHGLPMGARRRAGAVRRDSRSLDPRQDRGRRRARRRDLRDAPR